MAALRNEQPAFLCGCVVNFTEDLGAEGGTEEWAFQLPISALLPPSFLFSA